MQLILVASSCTLPTTTAAAHDGALSYPKLLSPKVCSTGCASAIKQPAHVQSAPHPSCLLQDIETFPLYIDRFPIQLLSFLRFSRIQDTAQFAMASFEKDIIVTQMNEYETLQLVMGELRDRFQAYIDGQVRAASDFEPL